jgi:hypothetical protein
MKKEAKEKDGESESVQFLLRIKREDYTRWTELGAKCGLSGNQFVIEAMRRYGDILAQEIIAENKSVEEAQKRHRDQVRARIQSSRR